MVELRSQKSRVNNFVVGHEGSEESFESLALEKMNDIAHVPWQVFINHIDSYHTRKLMELLIDQMYVPPVVEFKNEDIEEGVEGDMNSKVNINEQLQQESAQGEPSRRFEIIATVNDQKHPPFEDVTIISSSKEEREKFIQKLLTCGFIIYDITQDDSQIAEANWVLSELVRYLENYEKTKPRAFKSDHSVRHFILISSIMTWARTKPTVETSKAFTETDYRRRKAHPNFKRHIECERNVTTILKKHPGIANVLKVIVLCAGITYGEEEGDFHYAFKLAWHNEKYLPVIGEGDNLVPLIHVRDLASAVYSLMKKWPKLRYIVAVEQKISSQKDLIKAISKTLSTGKTKSIPTKDALFQLNIEQREFDAITVNLNIASSYLLNSSNMTWYSDSSFCDNIANIVTEYRVSRNLYPLKLIILGPPASGKSIIARELAKHYKLPYISLKRLISDTVQQLTEEIEEIKASIEDKEDADKENVDEEDANKEAKKEKERSPEEAEKLEILESLQEMLGEIQDGLKKSFRLENDILTKIFRRKLLSKECQNQGYAIDGYPKMYEQAKLLFDYEDQSENEDYEENGARSATETMSLLPDFVILLDAHDDFLMNRVINLFERDLQNNVYTEDYMYKRLQSYRQKNEEDNSPLQVFDKLEIHPIIFDVEKDPSPQMLDTFRRCLKVMGPPRNYGATLQEIEEERKQAEADAADAATLAAAQRKLENAERKRKREIRAYEWTKLLEHVKLEEEERLRINAEPLRHYLVKYVFPILTQGLIEVAKLRPDDPIDYLAEYLLKVNPEGKELEPDYSEAMNEMLSSIQQLQIDGVLPATDRDAYVHLSINEEQDEVECTCENRSVNLSKAEDVSSSCGCEQVDDCDK